MKKFTATCVAALLLTCGTVLTAQAEMIDFTDDEWSDVSGTVYTKTLSDGLTVTLTASDGNLTFNDNDPSGTIDIDPLAGIGDGIGIIDDEVSTLEYLTISFSYAIEIDTLYLLDVFSDNWENEGASISFNNGATWEDFFATPNSSYGFVSIDLSSYGALDTIIFKTLNDNGVSDFSVAGLTYSPAEVPEPATMLLFGAGLTALTGVIRRKRR